MAEQTNQDITQFGLITKQLQELENVSKLPKLAITVIISCIASQMYCISQLIANITLNNVNVDDKLKDNDKDVTPTVSQGEPTVRRTEESY